MKQCRFEELKIKGFEDVDIEKLVKVYLEFYNKSRSIKEIKKFYFNSRFFTRFDYEYVQSEGNHAIAFYSDLYFRQDHFDNFTKFITHFPQFDYVIPKKRKTDTFSISRAAKMLLKDIEIWSQVKKLNIEKKLQWWLLYRLGLIFRYYRLMEGLTKNRPYSYALVYNDSCPYENMLIQKFNTRGVHTATLQHGKFDLNGNWKGIEFRMSVADDFLAWNEWTKDLAHEAGLNNVLVLGIPRYISYSPVVKNEENIFCVVLGDKASDSENKELIGMANQLAEHSGLKFYFRYHPLNHNPQYEQMASEKYWMSDERKETIPEMCENSKFCLVGSGTSMVVDFIFYKQDFYEYNDNKQPHRKNTFRTSEELFELYDSGRARIDEDMFQYYCTTHEVWQNYKKYFDSLL